MASWMVHLRIADKLLEQLPSICPVEFIVGNIAPDSGVPNADWSAFSPSTQVSHFKSQGKKADPDAFAAKYFTKEQQTACSPKQYSFYLGYLIHLITDVLWSKNIVQPTMDKFSCQFAADSGFIWTVKEDWYDLDHKYLRDHPDFRAFQIYSGAAGFSNEYMEEFSSDAFDNRRAYITGFYQAGKEGLDREYPYLTEQEMDAFVDSSAQHILNLLNSY